MDNVIKQIEQNNWEDALQAFIMYCETNTMDDTSYIVGATLMEHFGERDSLFKYISEGLKFNPSNYELYMLLGNYYRFVNPDQAYLSYENALFHSINTVGNDNEDTCFIRQTLTDFREENTINVRNVSFVILSYNELEHTKKCINSIRKTCFKDIIEIIVIDNASTDGSIEWLREQSDIRLVENKENAGFPKASNQGISASDPLNDILLLYNDTIMMSSSLFWLRMGLYENDSIGAAGAVSNEVSKEQAVQTTCSSIEEFEQFAISNNIPCSNPYESKMYLVMFAMLIKRSCVDKTGLLDELFTPGNFEDNDYGVRLNQNGYKCVICHNAFIYHVGKASFGKDPIRYVNLYQTNYNKFRDKWGFSSDEYSNPRNDIVDLIENNVDAKFSVLEIGCGFGETLTKIRYRYPNSIVKGIELNKTIADIASKRLDVLCGDIEEYDPDGKYDYIILADVLDYLNNPTNVLTKLHDNLTENGSILVCVSNALYAERVYDMLTGNIPFIENIPEGMQQVHHFTPNSLKTLVEKSGYTISDLYYKWLPENFIDEHKVFFDEILKTDGVLPKDVFEIYQFLLRLTTTHRQGN